MTSSLRLRPTSGPAGTRVEATAIGFAPEAALQVSLLGQGGAALRQSGSTDVDGTAHVAFVIPAATELDSGWHGVVASALIDSSTDVAVAIFEVTAAPPAAAREAVLAPPRPTADPTPAVPPPEPAIDVPTSRLEGPGVAPITGGPSEPFARPATGPAASPSPVEGGERATIAVGGASRHRRPRPPSPRRHPRHPPRPGRGEPATVKRRPGGPRRPGVGVLLAFGVLGGGLLVASGLPEGPAGNSAEVSSRRGVVLEQALKPAQPASGEPPSLAAASRATQVGSGRAVTLAFGGDVHFAGPLGVRLAANPATVFNPARSLYAGADLMMVNLETAVTTSGTAQPKQFVFRAPPTALLALKAGRITVASQANNHGEDYGSDGLRDSIAAAQRAGMPVIGIGANVSEALAPYRATINGQRIAIVAATQVLDDNLRDDWTATDTHPGLASAYDLDHLLAAVRQARAASDTVVVYLHWGVETQTCPTTAQAELAHQLVNAGADIIVGSHTHVLLGGGLLDGAFVDYGLGNFAFYATQPAQVESGVLKVTVTGRRIDNSEWAPARLSGGVATPLHGASARAAVAKWIGLRACTDLG